MVVELVVIMPIELVVSSEVITFMLVELVVSSEVIVVVVVDVIVVVVVGVDVVVVDVVVVDVVVVVESVVGSEMSFNVECVTSSEVIGIGFILLLIVSLKYNKKNTYTE